MTMLKQHLFRYQGHIGAYLVVAGVDPTGVGLYTVHAHGSTDKLPYVTMGSGSLAAMSVFESMWQPDLSKEGAIALCAEAGSNVDVCVIEKDKPTQLLRNYEKPNERGQKERNYRFPRGTTAWLNQKVISKEDMKKYVTIETLSGDDNLAAGEKMEVDV
jgi:20S proteasome subunit beta 2